MRLLSIVRRLRRNKLLSAALVAFAISLLGYYNIFCYWSSTRGMRSTAVQSFLLRKQRKTILPILMPVCDRLEYLDVVLDALTKCTNIHEDCDRPEITRRISEIIELNVVHLKHIRPFYGIPSFWNNEYATSSNVYFLLRFAFDYLQADGTILLESDLMPSVDFYDYHVWAYKHFLYNSAHPNVLNVNSFRISSTKSEDPYAVMPYEFTVWGWSTSRKNWLAYIRNNWTPFNGWDIHIQTRVRIPNKLISVQPMLSRVKNIGQFGINFKVSDSKWKETFDQVFISDQPISYADKEPNLIGFSDFCSSAGICE